MAENLRVKNKFPSPPLYLLSVVVMLSICLAGDQGTSSAMAKKAGYFAPRRVQIANALRRASRSEAKSEYWLSVAKALNDDNCNLSTEIQIAQQARLDAIALASVQRSARLNLTSDLGTQNYDPIITPVDYSHSVNNVFYPIVPGRTLVYTSVSLAGVEVIQRQMTNQIVVVNGVSCRVMRDIETLNGVLHEDTSDFFAQRCDGSVWYFGEVAQSFKDGFLDSLDGSWRAGVDDAKPGIAMPANPTVGDLFRQEYAPNGAEDIGEVISVGNTVVTPAGTFTGCVEIEASSPMEPTERERKFFAPNVGLVKEINLHTGAVYELTQIIN